MTHFLKQYCLPLVAIALFVGCGGTDDETEETEASLSQDVAPIFQAQCAGCHMRENPPFPDAVANNVYYETKDDILGNIGTFIVAGDSANSGLVAVVKQEFPVGVNSIVMPPPDSGAPAMPAEDVAVFVQWIDEGAKDN